MKTNLLCILLFFSFSFSFSQINFEKGYFIKNNGAKIACLIKNNDWNDNPRQFEYKLSETSEAQLGDIESISEFGISDFAKYERHTAKIDRSSDFTSKLSGNRAPEFEVKKVFLKVLIDSKADLLVYRESDVRRFFFRFQDEEIEPLIYKRFLRDNTRQYNEAQNRAERIGTNTQFRQQLKSKMNCDDISDPRFNLMDYKESALSRFFIDYNYCEKSPVKVYSARKKRDWFNLNLRLGLNHSAFSVEGTGVFNSGIIGDYGRAISPRYGIEFEFFLPVNNNKWAVFFEPTYQQYSNRKEGEVVFSTTDYTTFEIPVGFRHYVFLTNKSKLFLNISFAFVFNGDSKITNVRITNGNETGSRELNGTEEYFSLGAGYNFNNKISLEFRYNTERDLLGDTKVYTSKFNQNYSLILGYSIF